MTGDQIRVARKSRGWTQDRLARAIGTTQSVISEIEGGGRVPNIATLERIAAALGLQVTILLTEPGEIPNARRVAIRGSIEAPGVAALEGAA